MAPGMPIPSWTRSRNGSSSVALSRNVGPAGDGKSVGNNRPRSWMACGCRCAVAGPTVQRTGSRSFPIASASSVSRAVVVVRHAKRCSDTGIPRKRPSLNHAIKQPLRIAVRLLLQNLIHQSAKRLDPRLRLATPQNYPAMYVPCCQVLQRSLPLVFRFNPPAPLWLGRHFVMRALTCLNARLLVHAQHVILRAQRFAFPRPRIQVQDRPGLLSEPRVPRKNPVFVLPGLDRRFVQHPPDRAAADLLTQRRSASPHQVGKRLATERFFRLRHHLTSHRLDQRLIQRGKKRPFGRGQDDLRRRNRRWPNDFANVALVERTDRPPRPPRRFPGTVAHEA